MTRTARGLSVVLHDGGAELDLRVVDGHVEVTGDDGQPAFFLRVETASFMAAVKALGLDGDEASI